MGMKRTARLLLNKVFIQRYLDALSGRDKPPSLVNEFVADERLRHHIALIEAAFPRFEISTEDVVGEADKIVVRGTMRGIHSGDFMGIAPTRRQVTMPFIIIFHVDGGRITRTGPVQTCSACCDNSRIAPDRVRSSHLASAADGRRLSTTPPRRASRTVTSLTRVTTCVAAKAGYTRGHQMAAGEPHCKNSR